MTLGVQRAYTQVNAPSPRVSPLGVLVLHRHWIFDGVVHSSAVYSVLTKFSTQLCAHSGTALHGDVLKSMLDVSELAAEHEATNGSTAASDLYAGWRSMLW